MYCHSCGLEHGTNTNYCKRCGVMLNQTTMGVQGEPVNLRLKVAGPFWALAALGIVGVITLTIFYKELWELGARDEALYIPFVFGAGLVGIVAIVMGLLLARFISFQTIRRKEPQQEPRPQPIGQPAGQVRIPPAGVSYPSGVSVVEESTRRMAE